jgi:hypothetical protein
MHVFVSRIRICVLSSLVVVLAIALAACERTPVTAPDRVAPAGTNAAAAIQPPAGTPADVNAQLAQLRALVAHFHDLEDAMAAGYTVQVTPCLELPGVGAMGFHYGNPEFIIDPAENALQPELLLYEPQKNGKLRFVGVEYIIPFDLLPSTATPPVVLGQPMHQNFEAGLWALHAWVGRENPTGIFEDWNPKVSCQYAQ